uniref:Carboxylic ester hydrolase n=1 Tax=Phakopsora pachyrhizi TaxID=170000 RepID=A0A0S1MIC4_PHAPC
MKSMRLNQPIIYVAANYRLGAFGFLGGKEVGKAKVGNLGLKDQRLALKWVKKYISRFGGDPKKVMLFGQSAGAMSVAYHLMAYNGKLNGLFRAAICESGSALTASALSDGGGQKTYDILIQQVGCSNSTDTLECLRKVEFQTLADAQNEISGILSIDFYPPQFSVHVDGEFLTDAPRSLINRGKIAKIPLISGNQDDEGTALGFGQVALISHSRFQKFIKKLFNNATESQFKTLLSLYPEDITQGSPFNTGHLNAITPVYKRYSALLGDFVFQSLRRKFMRVIQSKMPTWGYLDCGLKTTPILGSFHTSELLAVFDQVPGIEHLYRANDFQSRWINFAHKLNPNPRGFSKWEKYGIEGKIMKFGPQGSLNMIKDDFRNDSIEFLIENDGILVF